MYTCTIIAERLSVRQLILHWISHSVVMYVCMYVSRLGNAQQACYMALADGGPFVVHLPWLAELWYRRQRKKWAPCYTMQMKRLPISYLAVEVMMNLAVIHRVVTMQCTLSFGEGPDSWLGSKNSFNSSFNFSRFAIFPSSRDPVVQKRHVAWWAGPQMYYLMLVSAQGLPCAFITLVMYLSPCHTCHFWIGCGHHGCMWTYTHTQC